MSFRLPTCLLLLAALQPALASPPANNPDQLPAAVRLDLAQHHCHTVAEPGGMVRGPFTSPTSKDWAVMCLVYGEKIGNFQTIEEKLFLYPEHGEVYRIAAGKQTPGNDCEHGVNAASPERIRRYAKSFAPEELKTLQKLDHQGVELTICDKATIIYYFAAGRWIELQGAD